jgi:hypothetical protein
MISNERLIEFLAQNDNIQFLIELESLIPRVKEYVYRSRFRKFFNDFIITKIWEGYSHKKINDDYIIVNDNYVDKFIDHENDSFFHLALYGGIAEQNYFGIIGNPNKFNAHIAELHNLKNVLKNKEMEGSWKHWLNWKHFDKKREELLMLSLEEEIDEFFKQWDEVFWEFANYIKKAVEETNQAIASLFNKKHK